MFVHILPHNTIFFAENPAMPLGTPAPLHKRKQISKIITDLSHVTQDGKTDGNFDEYDTK